MELKGNLKGNVDDPKKVTHLFWNSKGLKTVANLGDYENLKVLFLHNNKIEKLEITRGLTHLTHLYLTWNNLKSVPDLNPLKNLRKLYLGHNRIKRLEGLQDLKKLNELHLEGQNIKDEFVFEPSCCENISNNLVTLNITNLNLTNLQFIQVFRNLKKLFASENKFTCPKELGKNLRNLVCLQYVDLHTCPAQRNSHYREHIIAGAPHSLVLLDGRFVLRSTLTFIKRFEEMKLERKSKNNISADTKIDEEKSVESLPKSVFLFCCDVDNEAIQKIKSTSKVLSTVVKKRNLSKHRCLKPLLPITDWKLTGKGILN